MELSALPLPLPLPFAIPPALAPAVRLAVLASPIAGAAVVLGWRLRETRRPLTTARIVAPPLGMATGFAMFLVPAFRVPLAWAVAALVVGAVALAWPMCRASALRRDTGGAVVLERSRTLLVVLVGMVAVRLAGRAWLDQHVTPAQTAALAYLLAFGMIARWRWTVLGAYRRLVRA